MILKRIATQEVADIFTFLFKISDDMETLMSIHRMNHERKPIFFVVNLFDWYDSPISGIAELVENETFFFFEAVAVDFNTGLKVYALIEADLIWVERFKSMPFAGHPALLNNEVEQFLNQNSHDKYLFRGKHIDKGEYELVTASSVDLLPFKGSEELDNDSDEDRQKWFSFFN